MRVDYTYIYRYFIHISRCRRGQSSSLWNTNKVEKFRSWNSPVSSFWKVDEPFQVFPNHPVSLIAFCYEMNTRSCIWGVRVSVSSRSVVYTCAIFLLNLENVIQIILSFCQKKLGCPVSSFDMNTHCDCRGTVISILIKGHIQDFVKFAISLCEKVFPRFVNHWLLRTNTHELY